MDCDLCGAAAVGELEYEDGEILVGCADCLLEILKDAAKPVAVVTDYLQKYCPTCEVDGNKTPLHNGACWMHGTPYISS